MARRHGKVAKGRNSLLSTLIQGYVTMKFNLNVTLRNLDGQILILPGPVVKDADGNDVQTHLPLTASEAIVKALTADLPGNLADSTDDKNAKYVIAKKIKATQPVLAVAAVEATDTTPAVEAVEAKDGTEVSLKSEEVTVIKEALGKLWGITTVGAVIDILEAE